MALTFERKLQGSVVLEHIVGLQYDLSYFHSSVLRTMLNALVTL